MTGDKKVKWIVQTTNLSNLNLDLLYDSLNKVGVNYCDFGLLPFLTQITNIENVLDDSDIYIAKGGTKFLELLNGVENISEVCNENILDLIDVNRSDEYLFKLRSSIDYDIDKFDFYNYSKLNLPLLNYDASFLSYKDNKKTSFAEDKFIKPSKDLKSFNGGILPAGTTLEDYVESGLYQKAVENEKIVISDLRKIFAEYRFFMIEDKIIGCSMYKIGTRVHYDSSVPKYIKEKALAYSKLYQPSEIYVMDLAETNSGIFIVEYNCWNASGLYHCDVPNIINEVTNYKKGK